MDNGQEQCPMCDENFELERLTRLYGIDPSSRRQDDSVHVAGRSTNVNTTEEDNSLSVEDLSISTAQPYAVLL